MKKKQTSTTPIKLDLSFGELPPGHPFTRVFPLSVASSGKWPIKDSSVEEAWSAYSLQRIPGELRGKFMDELWRVLVPGGKCTFIVPYWSSARAVQDPLAAWPPLCEQSFLYFNKKFREDNKIQALYEIRCDFDFGFGYSLDNETATKADDTRPFWTKHYVNAINDLQLVVTKRP